ncbi:hypothetical protein TCAL_07510 [Tigriopus californicus]|uniref:G domain-containing protein n=1 Tax=Tigriopus californicus TaxID=6832 RepID=A0A553PB56_TIGCA|nr:hypothetical protein TCAL_07510 [Tigriopus californicus]
MLTKPGAAFSFQRSKIVVKRKGNVLTSENARNAEKARSIAAEMAALLSRDDFTFVNNLNSRNDETCIICIGSTGTGKSATIAKCTGQDVPCGSGSARVTVQCATYSSGRVVPGQEPDPVWVDTVGWDDADLDDERTFKEILNFIGQKHLLRVKV